MSFNILETIQSKSREEWQEQLLNWANEARSWAQNNGDFACIGGFLAGVLIVIFYKFVAAVLAIGVIAGFVFFQIALPANEARKKQAAEKEAAENGAGSVSVNGTGSSSDQAEDASESAKTTTD